MKIKELTATSTPIHEHQSLPETSGVYFLIVGTEIVYIGRTTVSLRKRVTDHIQDTKLFLRVAVHETSTPKEIEKECIYRLHPVYNIEDNPTTTRRSARRAGKIYSEKVTIDIIKRHSLTKEQVLDRYSLSLVGKLFEYVYQVM